MGHWPKEKMERWVTVYTDAGWKEGHAKRAKEDAEREEAAK